MKILNTYLFGEECDKNNWNVEEIIKLCDEASKKRASLKSVPLNYIIDTLARAGQMFSSNGKYRAYALEHLKQNITFSEEIISNTLDVIPELLNAANLKKRMNMEMFYPHALEEAIERHGYDGLLKAYPRGVVLHVGAGNVFLGILDSMVLGLLTKNINIVKLSSSGSNFINLFMHALKEADSKNLIASSIAVLSWKGGTKSLEETVVNKVNSVFVWGGESAVKSYKSIAPINVRVEGFGPKTSFGVAYESSIINRGMDDIAKRAAIDASMWDQAACSSLHTFYIIAPKNKHEKYANEFLKYAELHFSEIAKKYPQGKLSPDEQVEITKARQLARVDGALGNAFYKSSFPKTDWTVIYEKNPVYRVSPLNRVLYVKTVESIEQVRDLVMPLRGYVQTVGVAGSQERVHTMEVLESAGISRVVRLGKMLEEANGSPHDGVFPMMSLVNWLPIEGKPSQMDRLNAIVTFAKKHSKFYKRTLKDIPSISSMDDFRKIQFLEKEDVLKNTPPDSEDLLTSKARRGIFFASGGSTGQPKYVFYDQHEYDHTCRMLAYTFEAAGLNEKDIIANLFVAGNLWSSWLSVEKAISYTKAISVPVGSNLPMENIVEYLKMFKVTAIIGLPSFIVRLSEYVKQNNLSGKLRIKKIFYGGEYVGDEMIKYFKSIFKDVDVRSGGYASADAGVLGFQCPHCKRGEHHLFRYSQYIEFVDTETLKPVKRGEIGELVVTGLSKKVMPIIRYRVGDLGRWIDKKCSCGRVEPMFEILGRCDDRIHVGGAHLFVNDLQKAIGKISELSFNFQVIIEKAGPKDVLNLHIEKKENKQCDKTDEGKIKSLLWLEIEKCCEDLRESVKLGWLDKPNIELLPANAIEKIARTGKIKKVIDRRVSVKH